jgi:hypothetical protein
MATSRVNLATLAVALIAGLVILHDSQTPWLGSLAGLTLLVTLFAFGEGSDRTGLQSFAFALVCGLALLCTCAYPLNAVLPSFGLSPAFLTQYFAPAFWLVASALFWFIDRSRAESSQPQAVSFSGYSPAVAPQPQTSAPLPMYETRPFAPAVAAVEPEPVYASAAEAASPVLEPPPTAAATSAVPVPPVLSGKEVSIYVTMMGEGMNVLRSVRAEHLGRDFYIIVDEMPADENWEYVPGQVVRCKKKNLSSGKGLVAYEEAPRAQ